MTHLVVIEIDYTRVAESHAHWQSKFLDSLIGPLPGGCVVLPGGISYFTIRSAHAARRRPETIATSSTPPLSRRGLVPSDQGKMCLSAMPVTLAPRRDEGERWTLGGA